MRAFPLSNWTEVDIWRYIQAENIPLPPLYFAKPRKFVERDGMLMWAEDPRFEALPGEQVQEGMLRFRTLGCWPLTGGIRSTASTLDEVIAELEIATVSERPGPRDRSRSGRLHGKEEARRIFLMTSYNDQSGKRRFRHHPAVCRAAARRT